MKDRTFEAFGMSVILAAEATFGGYASPVNGKDLKYKAPDNGDKNQTVAYDANEWLNNGRLVPATQTPENPQSPEQQEKLLNPFPSFAIKLGSASEFGVNSDDDIKTLNDHNSEIYKKIASSDDYSKLEKVLNAAGALVKVTNTPDVDYNPYIFAGVKDGDLYISGAAAGDNFHKLVFYGLTKTTVAGKESSLGILLQVQVSDFNRYTPGMALVKDNETGTVTYTPFVRDNQNPNESGMINSPIKNEGGDQLTPQPTPDPNLFAAEQMVFAKWVDGKYLEEGRKKLVTAPKIERWMNQIDLDKKVESMRKMVKEYDPNVRFIEKVGVPGYIPVVIGVESITKMADNHSFILDMFDLNEPYRVMDPDTGEMVDVRTAIAKQVTQFLEVAKDENGEIEVPVPVGQNQYGQAVAPRKFSADAGITFVWKSAPKSGEFSQGIGLAYRFSYRVTEDGTLIVNLYNNYNVRDLRRTNELNARYMIDTFWLSLIALSQKADSGGSSYVLFSRYNTDAKKKGINPYIYVFNIGDINYKELGLDKNYADDGTDNIVRCAFKVKSRVI